MLRGLLGCAALLVCALSAHAATLPYTYQTYDVPGAVSTAITDVNDAGKMVGLFVDAEGKTQGFWLDPDADGVTFIRVPIGDLTVPQSINSAGAFVGFTSVPVTSRQIGFLKQPNRDTERLVIAEAGYVEATGINDAGVIVGAHGVAQGVLGFLRVGEDYTIINVNDANDSALMGINNAGVIVGILGGAPQRGFILRESDVEMIDAPDALHTLLEDINEHEDVIGNAVTPDGIRGFLLRGGTFYGIAYPGARQTHVRGVNNLGVLVGDYLDSAGVSHGFFAVPAE